MLTSFASSGEHSIIGLLPISNERPLRTRKASYQRTSGRITVQAPQIMRGPCEVSYLSSCLHTLPTFYASLGGVV